MSQSMMPVNSTLPSFDELPPEILQHILRYCAEPSIWFLDLGVVNSFWFDSVQIMTHEIREQGFIILSSTAQSDETLFALERYAFTDSFL
jgi:hypothetical protein